MNEQAKIDRRRFMKVAGSVIGAGALACAGPGLLTTRHKKVVFPKISCGAGGNVVDKILVAYASRTGSTGEVAETIGQVMCDKGVEVDVCLAKDVTDLSPYRAAVVGSAIYMGKWMSDAAKFVEKRREVLSQMPIAYFTVCLTMKDDTVENRRTVAAYLNPVREQVPEAQPMVVGLFAGRLDYSKLPFLYRMIVKAIGEAEADYRNWEAIRTWAGELVPLLGGA